MNKSNDKVVATSITIAGSVLKEGQERAKALGLSFSRYIQYLAQIDLDERGELVTTRSEKGVRRSRVSDKEIEEHYRSAAEAAEDKLSTGPAGNESSGKPQRRAHTA